MCALLIRSSIQSLLLVFACTLLAGDQAWDRRTKLTTPLNFGSSRSCPSTELCVHKALWSFFVLWGNSLFIAGKHWSGENVLPRCVIWRYGTCFPSSFRWGCLWVTRMVICTWLLAISLLLIMSLLPHGHFFIPMWTPSSLRLAFEDFLLELMSWQQTARVVWEFCLRSWSRTLFAVVKSITSILDSD